MGINNVQGTGSTTGVGQVGGGEGTGGANRSASNQVAAQAINEIIQKYDVDKSGKLEAKELETALKDLMKAEKGGQGDSSCSGGGKGGGKAGGGGEGEGENPMDINKDGKVDMQDLIALLMGQGAQGAGADAQSGQQQPQTH
jgi:hypothetical protein